MKTLSNLSAVKHLPSRFAALLAAIVLPSATARATAPSLPSGGISLYAIEGVAFSEPLLATGGAEPFVWAVLPGDYVETEGDISTFAETGTAQGWNADDGCWEMELPFSFPFFGGRYSRCWVSDNGTICFSGAFSQSWYDGSDFLSRAIVAPLWADMYGTSMDVFVESENDHVTIRWESNYWYNGSAVNASATLYPNGKIVLSYGDGNANGGFIGVSAGDGETRFVSSRSQAGSMNNAADIVLTPVTLPDGFSLSENGVLSGTGDEPGEYSFAVSVSDANGETAQGVVTLVVEENPALRPGITSFTPAAEYVNLAGKSSQYFMVSSTHPDGGTVNYSWTVDGEPIENGFRLYTFKPADEEYHVVKVTLSATGLPKTAERVWKTGVLKISDPVAVMVSQGMNASLSVKATSSLPAAVVWHDAETHEEVATGETLALNAVSATASYYAVAGNAFGAATSAVATVTCNPAPAVGRIFKLTGPAFVGNRLVLRAKPYGDLSEAQFSWTRDGVEVSTDERLDVASLDAADFGVYVFTVTSPYGMASSEPFILEPAPAGVPVGWGASGHGRTTAPEGLTGVAQIASGMNFNLALATNGTVTAWGYNGHGGCDVPDGLEGVSFVAAGGYESMGAGFAVKTDGTIAAWGQPMEIHGYWQTWYFDDYDENGNCTGCHTEQHWYEYTNGWDTVSTIPAGISDVVQVAVGGEFVVALKADGSVVTWGREGGWWDDVYDDETGAYVGEEWVSEEYYAVPLDVTDVVAVAAGFEHVVTLHADGTVKSWGAESGNYGQYDVPHGLSDIVAVAATKEGWSGSAGLALGSDGTVYKWGDSYNYLGYESGEVTGIGAIDAGQEHFVALGHGGLVSVFQKWNIYGVGDIPVAVQSGALGIAAGGYHCTAILEDSDGDTISDADETLLGRDPNVWEEWTRTAISGVITVAGAVPPGEVEIRLYDDAGGLRGRTTADETGAYAFEGVVPGRYFVKIIADMAKDVWAGGVEPGSGEQGAVSTLGVESPSLAYDLEPGQADAWADVVPRIDGTDETDETDGGDPRVELPDGTVFYLDMWPAATVDGTRVLLGEVAASHGMNFDATTVLPHTLTVKLPGDGAQVPAPAWEFGVEGETVQTTPLFAAESGVVRVETEPSGAEVWIDYADEPLGETPIEVGNLAAGASHSHTLLLRKEGYLRPKPIAFEVQTNETVVVEVSLSPDTSPAVTVEVASAVPGMPIYLDYLPTGFVTPSTVGGMDPASHSGDLWHSEDHSILLRHEALSPFLPRAVPEWETDPETGLPVEPAATPAISIFAPNTYEWEWGEVTITEENRPDLSGSAPPSFGTDPDTGEPVFEITVANPVAGAYYTAFATDALGEPFTAAAGSVQANGGDEALKFLLDATPDAKFVRIVVSTSSFEEGDELPEGL